jgi:hypothetical protein
MIPKIIHQIWNTEIIPADWQEFVLSWHRHHPDWQYYLWSASARKAYIAKNLPGYLKTYNRFRRNVQKADIFRYIILEQMGGLYADLDMECLTPFDPVVDGKDFVVGREPIGHGQEWGRDYTYGNAMMAARPGHPFLSQLLERIKDNKPGTTATTDVLTSTGTFLMTDLLDAYRTEHGTDDTTVLEPQAFYPFGAWTPELYAIVQKSDGWQDIKIRAVDTGAVAIHYWWGTWVGGFGGGRLINPAPDAVDGFQFFPGVTSPGNNVGCGKRDVRRLARDALEKDYVVGFDTDGVFKSKLAPQDAWTRLTDPKPNEGLYVKESQL